MFSRIAAISILIIVVSSLLWSGFPKIYYTKIIQFIYDSRIGSLHLLVMIFIITKVTIISIHQVFYTFLFGKQNNKQLIIWLSEFHGCSDLSYQQKKYWGGIAWFGFSGKRLLLLISIQNETISGCYNSSYKFSLLNSRENF